MAINYWDNKDQTGSQILTREVEIHEIKRWVTGNTLDVGCGSGEITERIKNCVGIDISKSLIKIGQEKGINIKYGNITKIPFKDNTFDSIFSVRCFINLSFVEKVIAMEECLRVLKPNGHLILYEGVKRGVEAINRLPFMKPLKINEYNKYLDGIDISYIKGYFKVKKIKSYPLIFILKNYARTLIGEKIKAKGIQSKSLKKTYSIGLLINFFNDIIPLPRRFTEFKLFVLEKKRNN